MLYVILINVMVVLKIARKHVSWFEIEIRGKTMSLIDISSCFDEFFSTDTRIQVVIGNKKMMLHAGR